MSRASLIDAAALRQARSLARGTSRRWTLEAEEAESVALFHLWLAALSFEPERGRSFLAWSCLRVSRGLIDWVRKEKRYRRRLGISDPVALGAAPCHRGRDRLREVMQQLATVRKAIDADDWGLLNRHYLEGRPLRELSREWGWPWTRFYHHFGRALMRARRGARNERTAE